MPLQRREINFRKFAMPRSIAKLRVHRAAACLSAGFSLLILMGCDGGTAIQESGRTGQAQSGPSSDSNHDAFGAPHSADGDSLDPDLAGETKISIDNFTFTPETLEIRAGTRVVWVNGDDVPHTVRSAGDLFRSEALDTDDEFERMFSEPGTYDYYCGIHPHMTGSVVVK
jgi:plastocyanin